MTGGGLTVVAPDGAPEVRPGDDLAALLLPLVHLVDGDIVVVTSKVVSKAEGRLVRGGDRDAALDAESVRVVARRGGTSIVRTALGLTIAAAGIDRSNVEAGILALLPVDPDASARRLRGTVAERTGRNVGVVVTDTAGRPWREGQTDIAIGVAGVVVLEDHGGRVDRYGNELSVTAPAVADEIASAAELAQGKLAGRPFAVVRGRADLVLPPDDDGPGAVALVRPEDGDMFGYGAREAVVRALVGDPADLGPFGAPASQADLAAAVREVLGTEAHPEGSALVVPGPPDPRLAALAYAHGWTLDPNVRVGSRVRPATP